MRLKGKTDERVLRIIARHYGELYAGCRSMCTLHVGFVGYDDIFHDCILYVSQETDMAGLDEAAVLERFRYRFRMIDYQRYKDWQQQKQLGYADDIQTGKEEEGL